MTMRKPTWRVAGVALGGAGLVLCIAALVLVWVLQARLRRTVDNVFGGMDRVLVDATQRVDQTRKHVATASQTTRDVESALRDWAREKAAALLPIRERAAQTADRLASALVQVDRLLEVSESTAGLVEDMLSVSEATVGPIDAARIEKLAEQIAALRAQLAEATALVVNIQAGMAEPGDDQEAEGRVRRILQVALRLPAVLARVDSGLDRFAKSLSTTQARLQDQQATLRWWLRAVALGIAVVVVWMAAGQFALCRLAWRR